MYAELTSRMVMTMEWVEGARLSDRPMLDKYGLEPSRLVDTMVRVQIGRRVQVDLQPSVLISSTFLTPPWVDLAFQIELPKRPLFWIDISIYYGMFALVFFSFRIDVVSHSTERP